MNTIQPVHQQQPSLWALVPVKALARAKQRLEPVLGKDRSGLAAAMLTDVLTALAGSSKVTRIVVVTADPVAAGMARDWSAMVVDEGEPRGMNEALELGIEAITRSGGEDILIVPADIPLLTGEEVDRLVHEFQVRRRNSENRVIGIGPSGDRGGTNFLCFDCSDPIPMQYGPDSYRRHRKSAIERGDQPVTLDSSRISLDVDEAKDLEDFVTFVLSGPEFRNTRTWKFLQEHGHAEQAGCNLNTDINERSNSLPN